MTKLVLVTGAAGFIGSNVAKELMSRGYVVHGVDNFSFGNESNIPEGLHMYRRGFEDLSTDTLNEYETIIHCATSNIIYAMKEPVKTFQNNALHTCNMFAKYKGKIVYTSTSSVYGQATIIPTPETADVMPYNAYDTSKRVAEMFLKQRGKYTTLRLSNVYGPGQRPSNPYCGVLGKFLFHAISGGTSLIYGVGDQTRDYTYIDDVVDAIVKAVKFDPLDTEINIGTGIETSVIELIGLIENKGSYIHTDEREIDVIRRRALDVSKAQYRLGWRPQTKLRDGIKQTLEWMKNK